MKGKKRDETFPTLSGAFACGLCAAVVAAVAGTAALRGDGRWQAVGGVCPRLMTFRAPLPFGPFPGIIRAIMTDQLLATQFNVPEMLVLPSVDDDSAFAAGGFNRMRSSAGQLHGEEEA